MKAIVTVIGKDRVGIIAAVTVKLAECGVNVLDISQTIMQGNFTMVMMVDCSKCKLDFGSLSESLDALGQEMELSIKIQRTEIFDAMHTI